MEELRQLCERELGWDRFMAAYTFLRSSDAAAGDQEGLRAVLGTEHLNLARHVLRLVLLEDRVFRT